MKSTIPDTVAFINSGITPGDSSTKRCVRVLPESVHDDNGCVMVNGRRLLDRREAARILGFSMTTLNRRLASGALKADVIDPATGKLYFYPDVAERYFKPINNGSHLREPLETSIERVLARRKANAVKRYNTTYIKKRQ